MPLKSNLFRSAGTQARKSSTSERWINERKSDLSTPKKNCKGNVAHDGPSVLLFCRQNHGYPAR
jgi:hypothetical protein